MAAVRSTLRQRRRDWRRDQENVSWRKFYLFGILCRIGYEFEKSEKRSESAGPLVRQRAIVIDAVAQSRRFSIVGAIGCQMNIKLWRPSVVTRASSTSAAVRCRGQAGGGSRPIFSVSLPDGRFSRQSAVSQIQISRLGTGHLETCILALSVYKTVAGSDISLFLSHCPI